LFFVSSGHYPLQTWPSLNPRTRWTHMRTAWWHWLALVDKTARSR
jgi:hypothetical protein